MLFKRLKNRSDCVDFDQSSLLWGYGVALIPAGVLSDKFGGVKVMLVGCVGWSVATMLFPGRNS